MSTPQQKVGEEDILISLKKNAEEEAERRWETETDEVTQLYQKTAVIENVLLGEDGYLLKRKKTEGVKRKEDWHPYLLFCKEHREELKVEGHNGNELMSMLSTKWKDLSDGEKLRYSEIAKENKRRDLGDDVGKIKK
ncbi:HMG box domain-containing protein [Entamoeba marina]